MAAVIRASPRAGMAVADFHAAKPRHVLQGVVAQPAAERHVHQHGIEPGIAQAAAEVLVQRLVEEAQVKRHVMPDQDAFADELRHVVQHVLDHRGVGDVRVADVVNCGRSQRDGASRD